MLPHPCSTQTGMKKINLRLNRETVRVLSESSLDCAKGGLPIDSDPFGGCLTDPYYCGQTFKNCPTQTCQNTGCYTTAPV
jgi:hypothetical protein